MGAAHSSIGSKSLSTTAGAALLGVAAAAALGWRAPCAGLLSSEEQQQLASRLRRAEELATGAAAAQSRAERLRQEERTGRIRAEQRLRELASAGVVVHAHSSGGRRGPDRGTSAGGGAGPAGRRRGGGGKPRKTLPSFSYQAIGMVESCFVERNGCPRQGNVVPSSRAWLQLRPDLNPEGCVDGLADYSHLQVIFVFHQNTNIDKSNRFKAKIAPPRLQQQPQHGAGAAGAGPPSPCKVGVLATRTPHRPNPIGLSTAKIERIEARAGRILLSGLDLLDGTPVLDIKPYIPGYDAPDAVAGGAEHVRTPAWVGGSGAAASAGEEVGLLGCFLVLISAPCQRVCTHGGSITG
jgi:tRNA (Thr-GGU) A37 N-methylase